MCFLTSLWNYDTLIMMMIIVRALIWVLAVKLKEKANGFKHINAINKMKLIKCTHMLVLLHLWQTFKQTRIEMVWLWNACRSHVTNTDANTYAHAEKHTCSHSHMTHSIELFLFVHCLGVNVLASRAEDSWLDSGLRHVDFSELSHTSDLKIGTPVATLPGAWRSRASAGTGWPGISILWLDEVESLINCYRSQYTSS